MGKNIERLGKTLTGRMTRSARDATMTEIELGQLDGNLSLTTDSIKTPIPKGDYLVTLTLTGEFNTADATCTTTHNHRLPDNFRELQPGDRVLVAWCGNEPVIISIVVSS